MTAAVNNPTKQSKPIRMKLTRPFLWVLMGFLAAAVWPLRAQDTVTIPRARLQELERKEKELEALQAELGRTRTEQEKLRREKEQAEAAHARSESEKLKLTQAKEAAEARAAAAQSAAKAELGIEHHTPELASLAPLKKGEVVEAMDLMNHYRADAAGAKQRYGKHRIRVRGSVAGFDKTLFASTYEVLLQTTERAWKVMCSVRPPEEFTATFPAQHGETIMAVTRSGARFTLLRVGQTVEIEADCRGLKGQQLELSSGRLMLTE